MANSSSNQERDRILKLANSCVCNNLRRTTRAVTNYYDDLFLEAGGLRASQSTILVVLYLAGPQQINTLAEKLSLDRTTLTRNLKPLADQLLLTIEAGSDKRTKLVALTSQGEKVLMQILPVWEQAQTHMVTGLGQTHADTFLTRLAEATALVKVD